MPAPDQKTPHPAIMPCHSYDNLKELIKFAHDEKIVLMADEVYQENVYQDERPFIRCVLFSRVLVPASHLLPAAFSGHAGNWSSPPSLKMGWK